MRKRLCKLFILLLLAPLLLLSAFVLVERVRGRIALGRYKRALLAQGVKLSPQAFASGPAIGENGAPEVLQGYHNLQAGAVLSNNYPPVMKLTSAGRAIVGFRLEHWSFEQATNGWDDLAAELDVNQDTLAGIRAALGKPVLDNQVDFSQGSHMHFTHLVPGKALARWFGTRTQLALHDGRPREALPDLVACSRLPRLLARDHLVISELVRIAVAAVARAYTWEALQADGWTDADLARLQQAWQESDFADAMVHGLEGEIVFGEACYGPVGRSNDEAYDVIFGMEAFLPDDSSEGFWHNLLAKGPAADFAKKQLYCRLWRFAWLDQDERHYLEQMQRLIAIGRTGASTRSLLAIQPDLTRFAEDLAARNLYDRLRYPTMSLDSLSRVMNRAMREETERSLTLGAIALKRYALAHGRLPTSLDALAPEFLPSVPIDYMDGHPLRYHPHPDGTFTLYSVGEDGKDDGGDTTAPAAKAGSQNLWSGKDVVWPAPARPSGDGGRP